MNLFLSLLLFSLVAVFCTSCESVGSGSENNTSSASAIPWNKPASWEGAGALGGLGFQGTH